MIVLDTNAAIAAFQLNPMESSAVHRDRVRWYILGNGGRFSFPSVALAEYLVRFEQRERAAEFAELAGGGMHVVPFDRLTAEIAADIQRRYSAGRTLSKVARQDGTHRVLTKVDFMLVATAHQHGATAVLAADPTVCNIARFVGLNAIPIASLPDRPAPTPVQPAVPQTTPRPIQSTLFDIAEGDQSAGG